MAAITKMMKNAFALQARVLISTPRIRVESETRQAGRRRQAEGRDRTSLQCIIVCVSKDGPCACLRANARLVSRASRCVCVGNCAREAVHGQYGVG
jgi:hypothetical protein